MRFIATENYQNTLTPGPEFAGNSLKNSLHLNALRQDVNKAAAMRIPNFNNQSDAVQISLLAEIAGLNKEKVQFRHER